MLELARAIECASSDPLACDLRVASTRAYLQEKVVDIGLMPDGGGTFWLPRLVGTARALKAMLWSTTLEARELDELGLLASLVPQTTCRARRWPLPCVSSMVLLSLSPR